MKQQRLISKLFTTLFFIFFLNSINAQITKLTDLVGAGVNGRVRGDEFGYSIAASDNIIAVSARSQDYNTSGGDSVYQAGAVYLFYKNEGGTNNWGLKKKIVANGTNGRLEVDLLGQSIAISGNILIVSAFSQDYDANVANFLESAGAAYIFYKNEGGIDNWGLKKKITSSGTNGRLGSDNFGSSVSISGDIIVVGAYEQDYDKNGADFEKAAGAAYVFYKNEGGIDNWGQKAKLVGSGTNGRKSSDWFGWSVSISGDIVVVGAYQQDYDAGGANYLDVSGASYIFYKDEGGFDNWGLKKKITASGLNARRLEDNFGYSVSISNNTIVVGAYRHNYDTSGADSLIQAGAAYVFLKDEGGIDNWGQKAKLVGSGINGRKSEDYFGYSVAVSVNTIVVGAYSQNFNSNGADSIFNAGAVYVFLKDEGGINNWGFKKKLVGSGTNGRRIDDRFGWSVAVFDSVIVVAAYKQDYDANGANFVEDGGKVSVYSIDNTVGINEINHTQNIYVGSEGKTIHLSFSTNNNYAITVYDLMGRKITQTQTKRSSKEIISLPQVSTGYYIVKVSNGNTQQVFKTYLQ